jgi:hypothetical protein
VLDRRERRLHCPCFDERPGDPLLNRLTHRKRWLVAAIAAVVVIGAVVGGVLATTGSSSGGFSVPSASQLYAKEAKFGTFNVYMPGEDPDEMDRGGSNVDDTVRFLGDGRYQLTVQNVGSLGYINSFTWNAPNIVITKVIGSSSGTCTAGPERTVSTQYGNLPEASVSCAGMAISPPKCSCQVGGTATVTFYGHPIVSTKHVYYGVAYSRIVLGGLTLVPYHIPSYLGSAVNRLDLPLCAKGQQSTKARPCVHAN